MPFASRSTFSHETTVSPSISFENVDLDAEGAGCGGSEGAEGVRVRGRGGSGGLSYEAVARSEDAYPKVVAYPCRKAHTTISRRDFVFVLLNSTEMWDLTVASEIDSC